MGLDLAETIRYASDLARDAGALQLAELGRSQVELKGRVELVTEVDRACERGLVSGLLERFGDHDIYAEEDARKDERRSPYRWIIDPLDGTTNFAHGIPIFAVSLGLEERFEDGSSEIIGGVVYAPALGEMFTAHKGGGAWLNGAQRLKVSETSQLVNAVLATGFAYVRAETPNHNLDNFRRLSLQCRGLRRLGSAALDLCYTAAGRFCGYWEMHIQPYDVAAGALMVKEAGGLVTDTEGGQDWLFGRRIVAAGPGLHGVLRAQLSKVEPDGFLPSPPAEPSR